MSDNYVRPSWDEYFVKIMKDVGSRGTCDRGRAGCIIVKDKQILSTGYVGAPKGIAHCDEIDHELHEVVNLDGTTSKHCIRTTHAEQNAICQAAKNGVAIGGATIYVGMEPCYACAKMIINAGMVRVVCEKKYHRAQRSREILKEAGVELVVLIDEEVEYKDKS